MANQDTYLQYIFKDGEYRLITGSILQLITYTDLKELRDNNNLTPGMYYQITDYTCTTAQENTSSAWHVFDIIVTAMDKNHLSEEAWAAHHTGDTYFANSKLEAWKIWYCLDNDTTRFAWAQAFIDEHLLYDLSYMQPVSCFREPRFDGVNGNYCWYCPESDIFIFTDTLNAPTTGSRWTLVVDSWTKLEDSVSVQYVPAVSDGKGVIYRMIDEFGNDCPYDFKNILFKRNVLNGKYSPSGSGTNKFFYTFSFYYSTTTNKIEDTSIIGNNGTLLDSDVIAGVYKNIIKPYYYNSSSTGQIHPVMHLNDIVFLSSDVYDGTNYYGVQNNIFDCNCYDNTLANCCHDNIFGMGCHGNILGDDSQNNTFGSDCYSNKIQTSLNTSFGNLCYENTFNNPISYSIFEHGCNGIIFNCHGYNVKFGAGCEYITVNSDQKNIEGCDNLTVGSNCSDLNIDSTDSGRLQHIYVYSGIEGDHLDRKTLLVSPNANYLTEFKAAGSILNIVD